MITLSKKVDSVLHDWFTCPSRFPFHKVDVADKINLWILYSKHELNIELIDFRIWQGLKIRLKKTNVENLWKSPMSKIAWLSPLK